MEVMANSESSQPQKSPGFQSMHAFWSPKDRARRALVLAWVDHPVCLCGCEGPLVRIKRTRKQQCFLQGHEAKLKALALKVVRGEASPDEIPDYVKNLRGLIRFLKKMPELRKAFE
jgi:hypothetical protein